MSMRIETESRGLGGASAEACVMVIFGASGDLALRELVPAMYELSTKGLLPDPFAILGYSRSEWSDSEYRERCRASVEQECRLDPQRWADFSKCLFYSPGDFDSADGFARLKTRLQQVREARQIPDNVFFHLSAPPSFFGGIVQSLGELGLATSEVGWRRLVIEKPFGRDRSSAIALDREIRSIFDESQVYRIDHFLGKETVQNMLVVRFANPSFEPIWNYRFVDHVQITVAESIGIKNRGRFYEQTGVVRDMVQNHLLQLLCMVAIEPPVRYGGGPLRDETVKVLNSIRPIEAADCVLGQYGHGIVDGKEVVAYRDEAHVAPGSVTSTFAALRLSIDNWRWAGVPFYLRTGKRLPRKLTEVAVHFKPTPHMMFPLESGRPLHTNWLVFRVQPEEGILNTFIAKQPGPEMCLTPVTSEFLYADAFGVKEPPRAYAWLLHDVMQGDQTLFARADWIDTAWSIVDPVIEHWQEEPPKQLPNYAANTWGPEASNTLMRRDGREWRTF
jgi:glucose-6-phosphate 1-dehydrogenase